jgi:hypothetical protein
MYTSSNQKHGVAKVALYNLPIASPEMTYEVPLQYDIVQEDFLDSYRNVSLKSAAMLKWSYTYCPSAKYTLKGDDDMFVNIEHCGYEYKAFSQKLPTFLSPKSTSTCITTGEIRIFMLACYKISNEYSC